MFERFKRAWNRRGLNDEAYAWMFEPYEGDVLVNGKVTRGPGTDRIMVFQDFNQLFPWKTVEKNIQYATA